ncbi:MAG: hypothetical protein WAQ27_01435 [Candidatus Microsaccharimonas sp.]
MDEGPFRVSRPAADRRAVSRPEPAYRQPDEPQPAQEEPRTVQRAAAPHQKKQKKSKRNLFLIIGIAVVVVLAIFGAILFSNSKNAAVAIDNSKYQAVFFTNGQVYFGKLKPVNDNYLKLTDIYYLQTQATDTADSENPQETSTDQSNVQLIKLGDEIHGPEDEMVLSRDQVLFYENLKDDSKVVQSIESYKKTH